jgi:biotin operon repressor
MSTTGETGVNAALPMPPRAVMLSVKQLAERDGISRAAISKRVTRLRDSGLHVELDRQGHVALVNSAQYDELLNKYADPSKAQAPGRLPTAPLKNIVKTGRRARLARREQ